MAEVINLVGSAKQRMSRSSRPSGIPSVDLQDEWAVQEIFAALDASLSPLTSQKPVPDKSTLWDQLVSLYCKAAPEWLSERRLSEPVAWVQGSTVVHALFVITRLGSAKAALHLPAVRALLIGTAGTASLMEERGELFADNMNFAYPSLLTTLRLAALAAQHAPCAWGTAFDARAACAAVQLAVCAVQHCWEVAEKRLGGLASLPSEPEQKQLLADLAAGLLGASTVLLYSLDHIRGSLPTDAPAIFGQLFAASKGAFQLLKAAAQLDDLGEAVGLLKACTTCSRVLIHLLGLYTHPEALTSHSLLAPAYFKHSLEVALYLSASLNQAADTHGPQARGGSAAPVPQAAPMPDGLRGLLEDELRTLDEAVCLWSEAMRYPSATAAAGRPLDESTIRRFMPDAEAVGWGLQLSEQLMRLAAKRGALAAVVPLRGLGGEERDSSGLELTPCACHPLLAAAHLPLVGVSFMCNRYAGSGEVSTWLHSARGLVLTAAKLVRCAGTTPYTDGYTCDAGSVGSVLKTAIDAAAEIVSAQPAYGAARARGAAAGPAAAAAAAVHPKEANLTLFLRDVGFLAFGGIPALLAVGDDVLLIGFYARFLTRVLVVLKETCLLDEAVHASLGILLRRIFCGLAAKQDELEVAGVMRILCTMLSPKTAGLAIALVKDGMLAAAVDWAISALQLRTRRLPSSPGPAYVALLLRALCEAVDGAGGAKQLSLHPTLEGIPLPGSIPALERHPMGISELPWAQPFREKSAWQRVKQELLPAITEVCGSFAEQASSQGGRQLDTSAVFRDVAVSAGGCANARCTNLRGAREESLPLSICGACKEARYCSRACQAQDWKRHKGACAAIRESKGLA